MRGISWLAENRLDSQEGLCCMEWVSKYNLGIDIQFQEGITVQTGLRRLPATFTLWGSLTHTGLLTCAYLLPVHEYPPLHPHTLKDLPHLHLHMRQSKIETVMCEHQCKHPPEAASKHDVPKFVSTEKISIKWQVCCTCVMEGRSGNHCWHGKAISITYFECVCVCSLSYPACIAHAPYCHLWPVPFFKIFFPHYLKNGTIFRKNLLNTKCVFWCSLQLLSETFLNLRRTERDMIINIHRSSRKVPVSLSDCNET
jgi:hypothetical protein